MSPLGNRANSMQAGGVTNGNLQSNFGEEENLQHKEKQREGDKSLTTEHELTLVNDSMKHPFNGIGGPGSTLVDSSSVSTTPTGAVETVHIGFLMAISAGDLEGFSDDIGSEDTRMNFVEQPLLDN